MLKKREKLFSKTLMILLLVFIVLGFTVPGILDFNGQNEGVEPRVCQADADCYLMCEDKPVMVVCSSNICVQNSCEEENYYPYQQEPLSFRLTIIEDNRTLNLAEKSNSNDFFVKFSGDEVKMYSPKLSLGQVLEKLKFILNPLEAKVMVNGEENYAYGDYIPQKDDNIQILSSISSKPESNNN